MSDSQHPAPPAPPASPPPPPASPPPGGGPGAGPSGPRLPWEERQQRGFVDAFVETVKLVVQQPAEAFGRIRADGDYVSPLLFAGVLMMAATLVAMGISLAWGLVFSAGGGAGSVAVLGGLGLFMTFVVIVVAPIIIVIWLFVISGIFHGILSLTGGLEASRNGFEGSFKVVAYASVASVLAIVPVVGGLLNIAALGYLSYIGLPKAHGCTDRHALYALIPLAVCGGCGALAMVYNTLTAMF